MSDVPSDLAMWSGLVGFVLPPLMSVIIQSGWSTRVQSVVAFVVSLVAGAGTAWLSGNFVDRDVISCGLIIFTVGVATYYGFWKPTGISPSIERATTF